MHECPDCGQACDCDGEDTWFDDYDECSCDCWGESDESDEDECSQCYCTPCVCDTDPLPADVEYEQATRHNRG